MCGLTRQCASSAHSDAPSVRAHCHRDRAFDRLDDIGEADLRAPALPARSRRPRHERWSAARSGKLAHQLLRRRKRNARLGRKLGRAEARARGPAGGGGHQNDRIIGKMAQAHVYQQFGAFQSDLGGLRSETQPRRDARRPRMLRMLAMTDAACALLSAHPSADVPARRREARIGRRSPCSSCEPAPASRRSRHPRRRSKRGRGTRLSQSGRARRRLRQGRRGLRADARRSASASSKSGPSRRARRRAIRSRGCSGSPKIEAVINRMGFNNRGQADALARLSKRYRTRGLVGVNVGANKDSADRIADYVAGVRAMSAGRRLSHDQHQLAQYAGSAAAAGRGRARGRCLPPLRKSRSGRTADLPEGRAGPWRGRARADRPRRHRAQDRRDHRLQHHGVAAAAEVAHARAKRAAFQARR